MKSVEAGAPLAERAKTRRQEHQHNSKLLAHPNTTKSTWDGHCPGSIVVNLCFARGVWWGCVFHHHSFGAHVLRARTRETPGGWYWWLPVTAPPICLCFRFFRTSLSFGFPSALRPPQGYDERVYLECFQQSAPTVLLQNSCC